ncbi:MAG TPA: hypothetical protein VI299_14555 [Polyangiales bacterium]
MISLSIILALLGASAVAGAGYLLGLRRGARARVALRAELEAERARSGGLEAQLQLRPLPRPDNDGLQLRAAIHDALAPLLSHERVARDLSTIPLGANGLGELPSVISAIAERGGFSAVVLSDDSGLPLAAGGSADVDLLASAAAYLQGFAERAARADQPRPLACVVLDDDHATTVHRMFSVGGARFSLSAISRGSVLVPTALDAALAPIEQALAPRRSVG